MKVTMKDIADELNISINAVSIALNDKPGVGEKLRFDILKTADEMGYINQKKDYLSVYSKSNLCILMQSFYLDTEFFYTTVLESIVEETKEQGYFSHVNYFLDQDFTLPKCITERKCAGILVVGRISDENLMILKDTHLPVVLVDFTSLCDPTDCVLTHNKQGGYMMTSYILNKGYKTIGFFGDIEYSYAFEDRYIGYKQALIQSGLVTHQNVDSYVSEYSVLRQIERYVHSRDEASITNIIKERVLPEVFVCANDSNANLLIKALVNLGYQVPNDIGVVGFDDTLLCSKSSPKITTVQVQKELMGQVSVRKLIERIQRKDSHTMTELLSVKIIERESLK